MLISLKLYPVSGTDVVLRPASSGYQIIDLHLYPVSGRDVILRRQPRPILGGTAPPPPPPFPVQFNGFKIRKGGSTQDLCLVATADAPTGMGGVLRLRKDTTTYAVYLVETTDPNASALRIRTTTGTKAVRLKT